MAQLFRNNAFSSLGATLTNVATTLTVATGHGDRFPAVTAPDFCLITLQDSSNNIEIVRVTARTAGADSMTIQRAQDGTAARSWAIGDVVELRITAFALNPLALFEGGSTAAALRTSLGLGTSATVNTGTSGAVIPLLNGANTWSAAQTYTAAQTFRAANAVRVEAAATQDAIVLAGRAGGTGSFAVTLTPAALAASRAYTMPDAGADASFVMTAGDQTIGGIKSFSSVIGVGGQAGTSAQWTTVGWIRGISMLGGQCLWWPKGANAVSKGIGSAADNNIYFAASTADSGAGVTYPFTFDMSTGNFTATGNVTAYSDERLKKNWAGLPFDFVNRLAAVKHGTYERIDADDMRQVGVSAQALRELLPEAVMEDAEGTLSVAYGNAALVAAVKLAQRVLDLEARVAALEGR